MPFAGVDIPSIQLGILESYLKKNNIEVSARHLYIKAAEFYGITNYNYLIYPPHDSYSAQLLFSKYVFPEYYKKNIQKFRDYFDMKYMSSQNLSFKEYERRTDCFYEWFFKNVNWYEFDLVGFTLNYGQFIPSLAISKKMKQLKPEIKIIFGGSRTTGELGKKIIDTFDFIDYIVSGDGEESLFYLSKDLRDIRYIPNLIYRSGEGIRWNYSDNITDLNMLPVPDYDGFYSDLSGSSSEVKQYYSYSGRLPVEISRGCWWNKCTFCNLNLQHKSYREKNVKKIIDEIQFLSKKYKILSFQMIGNTLPLNDYHVLCEKIINLGADMTFYCEARADQFRKDDYKILKKAGFTHIQTGIESFSKNYLKKMNKGARVIDNIAALKFCRENQIENHYNIIVNYPNEEIEDYKESENIIEYIKQYLDPPQLCKLKILYGSPIQCNPEEYNVEKFIYSNIDRIIYPENILQKGFNFIYEYTNKDPIPQNSWYQLIYDWRKEYRTRKINFIKTKSMIDEYILFFLDGINFIKVYDKRNPLKIKIFNLDEIERKVFLACLDIVSLEQIYQICSNIEEKRINDILKSFLEIGIVYKEDEDYLVLPLQIQSDKTCLSETDSEEILINI
jgi:ribosomal peptide maturation radical SAM protein 1